VVGPKKTTPPSVRTASGKKRVVVDFEDDDEEVSGGGSPQASDSVKKRKINKNGLVTLTNGVVSMRELPLSTAVPTKAAMMMHALCLTPSPLGAIRMHCSLS